MYRFLAIPMLSAKTADVQRLQMQDKFCFSIIKTLKKKKTQNKFIRNMDLQLSWSHNIPIKELQRTD